MKFSLILVLLCPLFVCRGAGTNSTTLNVNPSTGAIVGPVSATTFASANALGGGGGSSTATNLDGTVSVIGGTNISAAPVGLANSNYTASSVSAAVASFSSGIAGQLGSGYETGNATPFTNWVATLGQSQGFYPSFLAAYCNTNVATNTVSFTNNVNGDSLVNQLSGYVYDPVHNTQVINYQTSDNQIWTYSNDVQWPATYPLTVLHSNAPPTHGVYTLCGSLTWNPFSSSLILLRAKNEVSGGELFIGQPELLTSLDPVTCLSNAPDISLFPTNAIGVLCSNVLIGFTFAPDNTIWAEYECIFGSSSAGSLTPTNCLIHFSANGTQLGVFQHNHPLPNCQGLGYCWKNNTLYAIGNDGSSYVSPVWGQGALAVYQITLTGRVTEVWKYVPTQSENSPVPNGLSFPNTNTFMLAFPYWSGVSGGPATNKVVKYVDITGTNVGATMDASGNFSVHRMQLYDGAGTFITDPSTEVLDFLATPSVGFAALNVYNQSTDGIGIRIDVTGPRPVIQSVNDDGFLHIGGNGFISPVNGSVGTHFYANDAIFTNKITNQVLTVSLPVVSDANDAFASMSYATFTGNLSGTLPTLNGNALTNLNIIITNDASLGSNYLSTNTAGFIVIHLWTNSSSSAPVAGTNINVSGSTISAGAAVITNGDAAGNSRTINGAWTFTGPVIFQGTNQYTGISTNSGMNIAAQDIVLNSTNKLQVRDGASISNFVAYGHGTNATTLGFKTNNPFALGALAAAGGLNWSNLATAGFGMRVQGYITFTGTGSATLANTAQLITTFNDGTIVTNWSWSQGAVAGLTDPFTQTCQIPATDTNSIIIFTNTGGTTLTITASSIQGL